MNRQRLAGILDRAARIRVPEPPLIFGMVDGLVLFLGLLAGLVLSHQSQGAVWHSALGGGLAELGGMSLGQYWSAPEDGKLSAFANGGAACLAAIIPAVPYAFLHGLPAAAGSLALIVATGALIAALRPERGVLAVARTFGLLVLVGVLSGLSGLL